MVISTERIDTVAAAHLLGMSRRTVSDLCRTGQLVASRVPERRRGSQGWRIDRAAVDALADARAAQVRAWRRADLLDLHEAADLTGLSTQAISEQCQQGRLGAHKGPLPHTATRPMGYVGWRIPRAAVLALRQVVEARRARAGQTGADGGRRGPPRVGEKRTGYPILRAVCAYYELSRTALEGPSREPLRVEARRVGAALLATRAGLGPSAIGRLLCRDHSTALHHLTKMRQCPTEDEQAAYADLSALLAAGGSSRTAAAP